MVTATVLWDLAKFYDTIGLLRLVVSGVEMGYNPLALSLSVQMYLAPRYLRACQCFDQGVVPYTGMVAGCGRAVRFTRIVLYGALGRAHNAFPQVIPTSFVDDLTQRAEGTMEHVLSMLPRAADILAEGLQEIGCTISPKSAATCNTCEGTAGLNRRSRAYGLPIEVKGMVRDLGVANTSGKRRSAKVLEGRFGKAFFRSGGVSRLAKVNRRAKKLFSTGVKPQASWGSTGMGMSPIQVRKLRAMAVRSTGVKGVGRCTTYLDHPLRPWRAGRPGFLPPLGGGTDLVCALGCYCRH